MGLPAFPIMSLQFILHRKARVIFYKSASDINFLKTVQFFSWPRKQNECTRLLPAYDGCADRPLSGLICHHILDSEGCGFPVVLPSWKAQPDFGPCLNSLPSGMFYYGGSWWTPVWYTSQSSRSPSLPSCEILYHQVAGISNTIFHTRYWSP